ncbi:MAG: CidA/LrgA family protein [Treponema sp.]|jgi:holin-like protein|nr:CidA/LrgA family protein [Treponema sp.]
MKIILQTGVIFTLCWLGRIIAGFLPFAFPASIIALGLVLCLLLTGLLRLEHIKEISGFLLSNMAFFLIPASVNVINYLDLVGRYAFALILICSVSMVITFGVTALTVSVVFKLTRAFSGPPPAGKARDGETRGGETRNGSTL